MAHTDIIVRSTQTEAGKGWLQSGETTLASIETLEQGLAGLAEVANRMPAAAAGSAWEVNEVELAAELTAEGGLRLIGCATAGVRGAITVRLSRIAPPTR